MINRGKNLQLIRLKEAKPTNLSLPAVLNQKLETIFLIDLLVLYQEYSAQDYIESFLRAYTPLLEHLQKGVNAKD